jgi:3-oxoacyl-[acyl-carrier protein] reductase
MRGAQYVRRDEGDLTVKRLEDKVALVTGAGRGIGKAIALALADEGAQLAVNYNTSATAADAAIAAITAKNGTAESFQADVSNYADASIMVDRVYDRFGRIDILVNNAGISRDSLLVNMTEKECWEVMHANFGSVFNLTQLVAANMMRERRGRIINITSPAANRAPVEGQSNYSASKAAAEAFTRCSALELARFGVTVNAVAPGFVPTDLVGGLLQRYRQRILKRIPMREFERPEDVGAAVAYLASDAAGYITGEVLNVDGGVGMSMGL